MRWIDRRTVRPVWVCETHEGEVEQSSDVEEFAEQPGSVPEREEGTCLSFGHSPDEDPDQESGQRRIKPMLDPRLPSEDEVR